MKAERDEAKCQAALDALREGARGHGAICSRSRSSARARARRWARSASAMEDVFGRYGTQPTPVKGIYGGAYGGDSALAAG